jgi:hypothetical protein
VIADPFFRTLELVALLRRHADAVSPPLSARGSVATRVSARTGDRSILGSA